MKKRLLILVGFLLYFTVTKAQEQSEHKLFVGAAAASELPNVTATDSVTVNFQFQIGGVLRFTENTSIGSTPADASDNPPKNMSFGFPFGVFYIPPTFISDKFEVSKGYFSNGVNIRWQIGANQSSITSIDIYRRLLTDPKVGVPETSFELIASVSPTTFEFIDAQVDGGVLFEYQIRATGVPITSGLLGQRTINYMDGIGYRNPTATVSGGVTFDSGSPVEDVTVFAEPVGAENRSTKSIYFPQGQRGNISIPNIENISADNFTVQAWISTTFGSGLSLLINSENSGSYDFYIGRNSPNFNISDVRGRAGSLEMGNLIPSGEIDAAGNDTFKSIPNFGTWQFVHLTIVFKQGESLQYFINGREVNESYIQSLEGTAGDAMTLKYDDEDKGKNYKHQFPATDKITNIVIQNTNRHLHVDEFRAWDKALTAEEIRRDYRRSLGGGENGLAVYLRMDEGAGNYLYDLSKVGFNQNKNDGSLNGQFQFIDRIPTSKQLGIFGVTDKNGSYIISGIPYKGTGESFLISPSLGVHKFEPASQTLFLGTEEPVVNQVNFTDISSFRFRGRVVYNVQDVFKPIASTTPTNLKDFGYNKYLLGDIVINKGEYYYEGGSLNAFGFYEGGSLKQYPIIGLEGANVLIDGNTVFDEDNQPILTDADGNFTVSVPIGNHKVEVEINGHVFELNGRFPETGTQSFFEDQVETQYFIDETRITVVGRVVGGRKEFEKPIGFGVNGEFIAVSNEGEINEIKEVVSSINNIGEAQITFKGDLNSPNLDKIVATNSETGEYKVDLIPYKYSIRSGGITIAENTAINASILNATETVNYIEIPDLTTSEFTSETNKVYTSDPYHYEKNFKYDAAVSLILLEQDFEKFISVKDTVTNVVEKYDLSELAVPLYIQKKEYFIDLEVSQNYINYDGDEPVIYKEFYNDGRFNITNNLEISGSSKTQFLPEEKKHRYTFKAGSPNISGNFEKTMNIEYLLPNSTTVQISTLGKPLKTRGIIQGGVANSGVSFATSAPETPDLILRDPPGSNSFASIERGSKISYTEESSNSSNSTSSKGVYVSLGPTFTISTGFISVFSDFETNIINDVDATFTKTVNNTGTNTTSNTYEFNQTISTSSEIEFVGSEGDLYIGNAKNVYYGVFDNIFITKEAPKAAEKDGTIIERIPLAVKDEKGEAKTIYLSAQQDIIKGEQATNTFFTYSQKYLVETLIPDLERLAALDDTPDEPTKNIFPEKTKNEYAKQADLWRTIIQRNEKSKYDAYTDRNQLRGQVISDIRSGFLGFQKELVGLVNDNFFANRSFDAGLGEFTNSVTSVNTSSQTFEKTIDLSSDVKQQLGVLVNNVGAIASFQTTKSKINTESFNSEREFTTTFSYTLKDNDRDNVLSVDILNLFDGNGPVFITKGGATSCPYEGAEESIFFVNTGYNDKIIGKGGENLSTATNRIYAPEISANKTLIANVPESEAAVFTLFLKNISETQSDLEFVLDVDPLSLNGATTNIEANGLSIFLPYNEVVEFPLEIRKSASSARFKYDSIKVFLASPCDLVKTESEDFIELDVEFKKSCSNVTLSAPENNWIFNTNEAYSVDIKGKKTTNTLPITFTDFNTDFNGFEKITLQYRNASAANWIKLQSYYGTAKLRDDAGDKDGELITSSDVNITYNWDIIKEKIADGNYEFRAISFCADNISNTSEISSGIVNLTAPVLFGLPKPTDGILDVGEDISVRFNEDIFNRTTTNISVTGLQNQQEIDHSVSVFLDGIGTKMELPNQLLKQNSSLTLQFWYNPTSGTGKLISQESGINVTIKENQLELTLGGQTITTGAIPITINRYNFYSFVYQKRSSFSEPQLLIIENGVILKQVELDNDLDINTSASVYIGAENVIGNIHDIRMWSKAFTAAQATVAKDLTLTGRELNLTGYWKLDEGFGNIALDKAKRKNAIVNLDWAIFPKGTGYEFKNSEYLTLDNVNSVQISNFEDVTLSFWLKPNGLQAGTILSNGFGDSKELVLTNGFRNKWSVNVKPDGNLELQAENTSYALTSKALTDNKWTHVALVVKRGGSLRSFIDGEETTSVSSAKLGGLTGNKFLLGARLYENVATLQETIDNKYSGLLDEVRLWNTARSIEQIKRDRYFEITKESDGLLLYVDFNEDENNTTKGPAYNHADVNETISTTFSILSGATQSYTKDSPALKPKLQFTNIPFTTVINGDQMIIQPDLTDQEWSLYEGEIINFSISRLSDTHFNTQLSPVTWSALVNRQELEWFTEEQSKEIVAQKIVNENYSFTMDLVNIGGSNQPYTISGLPTWMKAENASGSVSPDSNKQITFTVDSNLALGNYTADIVLETTSGFNDRLSFNLRVLTDAPDWTVNVGEYDYGMNIIGRIEIDNVLSRDQFTKVGAFVNDEARGEAYLTYDDAYDSYFVYLTMYSNVTIGEDVTFKIWDAVNGKIIVASIDGVAKIAYENNDVIGLKSKPKTFSATNFAEQNLEMNTGWNWVSFFTNDPRFNNLTSVFDQTNPEEGDYIKSQSEFAEFEFGDWNGSLTELSVSQAYKIRLNNPKKLRLVGQEVNSEDLDITINENWNWLPFPIHRNISIEEALAFFNPTDGDLLKDQFSFSIYDAASGWSGTLNYLEPGTGYMLRAGEAQVFNYPNSNVALKATISGKNIQKSKTDNNANFAQYSSNMNIVAEVIGDENFTKVLVFDNDNVLRGTSEIVEIQNRQMTFITVFSNSNDNLRYVLANGFEEIDIDKSFVFANDNVLGNMKNPIQLSAKALSLENLNLNGVTLYPNPFTNEIMVDFTLENVQVSKIEVFNTLGITVFKVKNLVTKKSVINTANYAKGVYMIRLTDNEGNFATKKMVKE